MRNALPRFLSALVLTLAFAATGRCAVLYTYDFPGSPGSGLAANQTNGQPAWGTFGDFTRTGGLTQMPGAPANNTYGTESWNLTGSIDTTQYEGFTATAGPGVHFLLTNLTFDLQLKPSGPANFRVGLFLNGSSTAFATYDLTPTSTMTNYNFDFTDLTDLDNATTVTFKFFGWNASASGGGIILDNVITNGTIVPEANAAWFALLPIGLALSSLGRAVAKRRERPE